MSLAADLRARLVATAGAPVPFASDLRRAVPGPGTPAAVLIAITDRGAHQGGPGLILTLRPETMRRHAGQVAFPGGRIDPGDADAVAAALREAAEEVALPPAAATIVGRMASYRTVTGFDITPVVAVVPPDLPLVAAEAEVAAVFEVPLGFVLDPANRAERVIDHAGEERRFIELHWGERRIWGATAAMLVNLAVRLA